METYLDYNYYEFLEGGQVKHHFKYIESQKVAVASGTWEYRESEFHGHKIMVLDVDMENSSFPMQFIVYDGYVREGSGREYTRMN